MDRISYAKSLRRTSFGLILILAAALAFGVACGSDDGGGGSAPSANDELGVPKIAAPDTVYTLQNLLDANFKKSKTYDVTGLDGATEAYYGFFGADPYNRKEYEVRLYPTQAEALDPGVSFATESSGEDAVILESVQRWKVGLTERRQCAGNGGHHSGKCDGAKYGDFVVRGNMILMCQGRDSTDAITACKELLDALPS
jgi:hypothetical protein